MNTGQASAASNPLFPQSMPYAQQPTYVNHPVSAVPPGAMYPMGGMPGGQPNLQYRMLTGLPSATAGHGGPLGSGPPIPGGVGRAGAMPMTVSGQPQVSMRYGPQHMAIGRGMQNGMVQNSLGRGMPVASMRMPYPPGMTSLPAGTRVVSALPGGMAAHPGPQYVNQHGHPVTFTQISQSQQQHANPNGPGGPGQPPAHMLPQQPPGGPPQQPPPLGGPGTTHPGGQGQKLYTQQQPFMGAMTSTPMGVLPPPPNGGSPVRNPSPSAATPANAQTPGGPGAGRGMINAPTPANAPTPFTSTNAATPGARPGTASGQPNPTGFTQHTPRMTAADAMAGAGLQSSPGTMQRNPSTNMGLQQQRQVHLSQQGGQPQPGGPGGPGSAVDHSALYRPTPADMENQSNMRLYGPGRSQGPMEDVRFTPMSIGATQGQLAQQDQQRQRPMMIPPQGIPGPIQPQHTGGSMSSQAGPGARPLVSQQTGGSIQDSAMNGPGNAASGPGGRTSVPSTPQMANRQASVSMNMSGGPPGMMRPGSVPAMQGHPTGTEMAPPPPRNDGFRPPPMELGTVSTNTMIYDGMTGVGTSRHAFGVLRLLQLSSEMGDLSDCKPEKWSRILEENFTANATLSFRAQKDTGQPTNTFVHLPFPLLARFFATLTESNINRMSLILDGAIESQEGQSYTVFCSKARWPMHYHNGYIMELNGVLRARCKTVPVNLPGIGIPAGAPGSTPGMASAVPAGNTNGMGSSPSGNNMQASPTSKPSNTGNLSYDPEPKPYIAAQNVPYMVKIDELSFDSESVEKFIDAIHNGNHHRVAEPENVFGVPRLTMRMLEFCEGSQALEPVIDFGQRFQITGPLNALDEYSADYVQRRGPAGPPRDPFAEQYTLLPGQPGGMMKNGKTAVKEVLQSGVIHKGSMGYDDLNSGSPSTLSANVIQPMTEFFDASSSTSDPNASPSLATKTPGKKNTTPGSPTKATANGSTDKDKGGGKRKNTNDVEGPSKRRMTRKASKAN